MSGFISKLIIASHVSMWRSVVKGTVKAKHVLMSNVVFLGVFAMMFIVISLDMDNMFLKIVFGVFALLLSIPGTAFIAALKSGWSNEERQVRLIKQSAGKFVTDESKLRVAVINQLQGFGYSILIYFLFVNKLNMTDWIVMACNFLGFTFVCFSFVGMVLMDKPPNNKKKKEENPEVGDRVPEPSL